MASDDKEKGSEKKAGGSRKKTLAKKRVGEKQSKESFKRQKMEDDAEKEELRAYLDIIPGDDVAVSVESLATKYPIVDWKTHVLSEDKMYYEIIRANGSTKSYKIFTEMLDDFDRQDVLDLYRLVKERFETASLEDLNANCDMNGLIQCILNIVVSHVVDDFQSSTFDILGFPALKYVVPTGKDNFIVSAGRPNMVPAGRTIVSPGSIIFGPVPTGKDNFIVSAGRPNMVPAGRTIVSPGSIIFGLVAGKPVSISEASIRSDLQFNDAAGIDVLPNQAIFDTIQLMGYEGDLNTLTFNKGLFSPQWKFLFHTIIHCLSSKSTSWDQIPTNIATAVICLATNQVYNFSKLIFDGMMRHLDAKKKFVMYPRFIPVFLTNQLKNVPVPLDHFPINALTTKVFSFMVKKGKKNSGNVTPLFPSMLAQPTEDEGVVLERPSETQPTPSPTHPSEDQSEPQPDPFLRPSSSNPIPDSILEGSGGNHGAANIKDLKAQIKQLKKKARPVINHHKAWIKSLSMKKRLARKKKMESVSKQGRKTFKSVPTVHKDPAFDDLDDAIDYMETEDAHDEGTMKDSEETRVSTEDQVSTDKPKVSTDKLKVSTDKPNEGTAEPNEGTAEPKDGNSDESAAPTTVFRDDETIAQFLVTMSQNKTKQKGVEIKEIKDTDRPRTTTERSILTLKPLPKIDPKDKGKKVLEEKAESDAESEGVNEAEKKFKMLANDEEIARKVQEEWEAEEEKKKLAEEEATKAAFTNEYDFIQARLNADKILAEKLQEEEREKFTIEQRAKFLHDTIAAQRRFLAQQRSEVADKRKGFLAPNKGIWRGYSETKLSYMKIFRLGGNSNDGTYTLEGFICIRGGDTGALGSAKQKKKFESGKYMRCYEKG
ncbi:hypothetical protein Tco_0267017 [Tanacetum coccineum]